MYAQNILSILFQLPEYNLLWEELKKQCPSINFTDEMDEHRLYAAADYLLDELQFLVSLLEEAGEDFSEQELAAYLVNKMTTQKDRLYPYLQTVLAHFSNEMLSDYDAEESLDAAGLSLDELGMTLEEFKELLVQGAYDKSSLLDYFISFELFRNYPEKLEEYRTAKKETPRTYTDELFDIYKAAVS